MNMPGTRIGLRLINEVHALGLDKSRHKCSIKTRRHFKKCKIRLVLRSVLLTRRIFVSAMAIVAFCNSVVGKCNSEQGT